MVMVEQDEIKNSAFLEQVKMKGGAVCFIIKSGLGIVCFALSGGGGFIYHGWPKLKAPAKMAQGMGWTSWKVALLGIVEFGSGLMLLTGFHFRWAAVLLTVVMLGAIYYKIFKWKMKFSMSASTGWELDFILLAANVAIIFT